MFLISLTVLVVVSAVLSYGIGYAIFAHLGKEDVEDYGQRTKWTKTVDVRTLGDLASNPQMQNKIAQTTEQFPQPRLQIDDGNQEIADLHAKEDLLLENYSWVDKMCIRDRATREYRRPRPVSTVTHRSGPTRNCLSQ